MNNEHGCDAFDLWRDQLNIRSGGYSRTIDEQIYLAAKLIVESKAEGTTLNCNTIAAILGISSEHAELIQYILASVSMPVPSGKPHYAECFTYGASPRGLFVDNIAMAQQFLAEFEQCLAKWDEE